MMVLLHLEKGRPSFCQIPPELRESKVKLKSSDYAAFPLTSHGEMMLALIRSGASSYPHPTVSMQFFETIARYGDFFKVRPECVGPVLTALIDAR